MKNGDIITTVILFSLVLPWLVRLVATAKLAWRALTEVRNKKRSEAA